MCVCVYKLLISILVSPGVLILFPRSLVYVKDDLLARLLHTCNVCVIWLSILGVDGFLRIKSFDLLRFPSLSPAREPR